MPRPASSVSISARTRSVLSFRVKAMECLQLPVHWDQDSQSGHEHESSETT